jgi:sterol desaturase/sphingolipid hydroxylase (fatty acid hydroxylase superfamily)
VTVGAFVGATLAIQALFLGLDLADRHATRAERYAGERLRASSFAFLLVVIGAFLAIQVAGFALVPRVDGLVDWVRSHVGAPGASVPPPNGWRLVLVAAGLFYLSGFFDYAWHRWFSHNRWFWFTHESHHLPTQVFVGMPGLGVRPFAVLTVVPLVAFTAAFTYGALRLAGRPMWDWTVFQLPLLLSSTLLVTSHSSFMRRGWWAHRILRCLALTTPHEHVLHHTTDLRGNYGNFTTIWDRVFGTYLDPRLAEHQNKRYGLAYDQDFLGAVTAGALKLPPSWRKRFQLDRYLNIER